MGVRRKHAPTFQKPSDAVGEVSRSVATPPVIGKMDLQSGGRSGLPGRHLWEQTANSDFANSVRWFVIHGSQSVSKKEGFVRHGCPEQ